MATDLENDDIFAEAVEAPAAAPLDAPGPGQQPMLGPQQPRAQKARSNVQTMMLILSLAAIVTSCVLLYLYLDEYGDYPWFDLPPNVKAEVGAS